MIERENAGSPATASGMLGDDRGLDHTGQLNNIGNPKHLIVPLLVLVGILLAVLSALLHRAVIDQNAQAAADSVHLARAAFATIEQDLRVSVRDYSWWQEAIDNLIIDLNPDWAKDNVGTFVHKNNDVATTVVLGADNTVLYMAVDGERVDVDDFAGYGSGILGLADKVRSSAFDAPIPSSAYVTFRGELHLTAAGAMTPEHPTEAELVPHSRPVLIFTRRIDETRLKVIAETYLLPSLRFTGPDRPQTPVLPLLGTDEAPAASLTWDVDKPGATLLRKLTFPAAAVSLIVMGLMTVLCRRILRASNALQRAAAQLQDQNARLVRSEAIAVRALSEVAAANQHKSQFLAQMSHELRTPLNAIIGLADAMTLGLFGPLSRRYQEYAGHIHSSGQHLLALVNELLDLSRIEAGTLVLAVESVEVAAAISDSAKLVERTAADSGVTVVLEIAPDLPPVVADARALLPQASPHFTRLQRYC
jgi:signal transduction histidine kinase